MRKTEGPRPKVRTSRSATIQRDNGRNKTGITSIFVTRAARFAKQTWKTVVPSMYRCAGETHHHHQNSCGAQVTSRLLLLLLLLLLPRGFFLFHTLWKIEREGGGEGNTPVIRTCFSISPRDVSIASGQTRESQPNPSRVAGKRRQLTRLCGDNVT